MEDDPLDHLGAFLMRNLRDKALHHFEFVVQGRWKAPALQSLQADFATLSAAQREIARRALRDAIDSAIHDFLFALQEQADFDNRIALAVDGVDVVKASDGIHGEPFGDDGWFARFSTYGPHRDTA